VPGAVTIEVIDDGAVAPGRANGAADGNGVRGMRERATALGGTLEAAPVNTGGWRVRATLPVAVVAPSGAGELAAADRVARVDGIAGADGPSRRAHT
jgi:signal transduction histidine kinase